MLIVPQLSITFYGQHTQRSQSKETTTTTFPDKVIEVNKRYLFIYFMYADQATAKKMQHRPILHCKRSFLTPYLDPPTILGGPNF